MAGIDDWDVLQEILFRYAVLGEIGFNLVLDVFGKGYLSVNFATGQVF